MVLSLKYFYLFFKKVSIEVLGCLCFLVLYFSGKFSIGFKWNFCYGNEIGSNSFVNLFEFYKAFGQKN